MRKISLGLPALAALLALAQPAFGNGFGLQDFDAKALGMSNAFAATADNPSANFYNPAGITQLDGVQGSMTGVYIQNWTHFSGANASEGEANTKANPIFFPAGFGSAELTNNLSIGFGMFSPFGLSIEWPRDWAGRYNVTKASIQVIEFNPNVAFKQTITEGTTIAVAAGFSLIRSALKLEQAIDLGNAPGQSDGFARVFGDTDDRLNFRYDFAVLLSFLDRKLRLGAVYRSAIEHIGVHGTAEFDTNGFPAGLPPSTRAFTRLDLPDQLRMGVAVQPMDMLTLELDATWTNWSKVDKVFLEFDDIGRKSILDFGFNDSWFIALGANIKLIPDLLSVRAGVYYDETPTRLETRTPALPDSDRKGFSLGFGVTPIPALSIDVAYLSVFFNTARKANDIGADLNQSQGGSPRGNGDYTTYAHVIALTIGLKF